MTLAEKLENAINNATEITLQTQRLANHLVGTVTFTFLNGSKVVLKLDPRETGYEVYIKK